jgi:hypothetical protein
VAGYCEHGTESSSCMEGKEFFDQHSDCQLLKKVFAQ